MDVLCEVSGAEVRLGFRKAMEPDHVSRNRSLAISTLSRCYRCRASAKASALCSRASRPSRSGSRRARLSSCPTCKPRTCPRPLTPLLLSKGTAAPALAAYTALLGRSPPPNSATVPTVTVAFAPLLHTFPPSWGIRLQNALGFFTVGVLLLIIITGFVALGGHVPGRARDPSNFTDSFAGARIDGNGFVNALYGVIWAFLDTAAQDTL